MGHRLFAFSEENLEDVILPEKLDKWTAIRSRDCTDTSTANTTENFLPRVCCNTHKKFCVQIKQKTVAVDECQSIEKRWMNLSM